jgi:anti-sigma factor RsiW
MNGHVGHVTQWLGAYHDDELQGFRLHQVEAHLEGCATCRAELESLQALSTLLQESPAAAGLTSPERFVAQVGLRLPRRPAKSAGQRALETGWGLIPVGLFGAWAFAETTLIVAGVILIALQLGAGGNAVANLLPAMQQETWLTQALSALGVGLSDASRAVLGLVNTLGWELALNLALLMIIGILYWSWLASWWARRQRQAI